jgi:hypothetical protein
MKISESALLNMILREGSRFVGLREVRPNATWENPMTPGPDTALSNELRSLMRPAPWQDGWAYCAAFTEAIVTHSLFRLGANPHQIDRFAKLHGPHVMTNVRAFRKAGLIDPRPTPGALWLARHGSTDRGHEGIVVVPEGQRMSTIEANTSAGADIPAKEREGDWITNRLRNQSTNGKLITQGYISVVSILRLIGD